MQSDHCNKCFLKFSTTGAPTSIRQLRNVISGFSLKPCQVAETACSSQTYSNLNFLGMELSVEYVSGPKACHQLCTDTIRCQFFTYVSNKTSCNRESKCKCSLRMTTNGSPDKIVPVNGMVSGYSLRLCQVKAEPANGKQSWIEREHLYSPVFDLEILSFFLLRLPYPQIWRVYSGILKQSQITEDTPFFGVQEIIVHPKYELAEKGYDIALMKLDRPMNFTDFQQPLCLPLNEETNMDYSNCWVTGWGYAEEKGEIQDVLQKVNIPLISNTECQLLYQQHRISDKMLCAGYRAGGMDACKGDSGGPLACKHEDTWYLVGITSWGEGCGQALKPGVYSKVMMFSDWFEDQMAKT
ncbi:hypothetical protein lerEdw1_012096 [Lerista edwardsae]|nr:hypothetical protein lerEdw1_012096 [Lerista edwardsae]